MTTMVAGALTNLMVVPGSHRANRIDAIVFDRRIWHARSDNHSPYTRRAVFLGYTYRWVHGRDEVHAGGLLDRSFPPLR